MLYSNTHIANYFRKIAMRIIHNKLKYRLGERRAIKKFLWSPVRIGDVTRWQETAIIYQAVKERAYMGEIEYYWENIKFVN